MGDGKVTEKTNTVTIHASGGPVRLDDGTSISTIVINTKALHADQPTLDMCVYPVRTDNLPHCIEACIRLRNRIVVLPCAIGATLGFRRDCTPEWTPATSL